MTIRIKKEIQQDMTISMKQEILEEDIDVCVFDGHASPDVFNIDPEEYHMSEEPKTSPVPESKVPQVPLQNMYTQLGYGPMFPMLPPYNCDYTSLVNLPAWMHHGLSNPMPPPPVSPTFLNTDQSKLFHDDNLQAFPCEICDKMFYNRNSLTIHKRNVHKNKDPSPQIKCGLCSKFYNNKNALHRHMKSAHQGVRYFCNQCDQVFTQSGALCRHTRTVHEGEKSYVCHTCGKAFTNGSNLRQHMQVHGAQKLHECPHCSSTFTQVGSLYRHIRSHHNMI